MIEKRKSDVFWNLFIGKVPNYYKNPVYFKSNLNSDLENEYILILPKDLKKDYFYDAYYANSQLKFLNSWNAVKIIEYQFRASDDKEAFINYFELAIPEYARENKLKENDFIFKALDWLTEIKKSDLNINILLPKIVNTNTIPNSFFEKVKKYLNWKKKHKVLSDSEAFRFILPHVYYLKETGYIDFSQKELAYFLKENGLNMPKSTIETYFSKFKTEPEYQYPIGLKNELDKFYNALWDKMNGKSK